MQSGVTTRWLVCPSLKLRAPQKPIFSARGPRTYLEPSHTPVRFRPIQKLVPRLEIRVEVGFFGCSLTIPRAPSYRGEGVVVETTSLSLNAESVSGMATE